MTLLLETLTDEQRAAVETTEKLVHVSAGPGTGKTRVIASRIAWLLDQGTHPSEILALVFTRAACAEIKARVFAAHPEGAKVRISTFHELAASFCVWPDGLQVATEAENEAAIRGLYEGPTKRPARELPKLWALREALRQYEAKGGPDDTAILAVGLVRARLEEAGLVPTWELVHRLMATPSLMVRWDHTLVDEVQDTTPLEQSMANTLSGGLGSLFAVGDPRQAIMGFRGAADAWKWSPITHRLTRTWRFGERVAGIANGLGAGEPIAGSGSVPDDVLQAKQHQLAIGSALAVFPDSAVLCRTHRDAELAAMLAPERLRHVERDPLDPLSSAADSIAAVRAEGKVPVVTVHSAKGLEWDQVVLFGPSTSDYWWRRRALPEEVRTLYVAVTRARRRLVLVEGDRR